MTIEEAERFCSGNKTIYGETSARSGKNVQKIFQQLVQGNTNLYMKEVGTTLKANEFN